MESISVAYMLVLGWLHIGAASACPPYICLNIDPVIFHLGPLAVRWYGLMYVVGIVIGLWAIKGYMKRKGITEDLLYRVLWWCIGAGLIGGRLYFVVQQPDLVQGYILQPWRILATWEGGMAFYGAIFLVIATLIWQARVKHVNPLVLIDAGVLFAVTGQIFGRIGNIINGDIIGYPSTLPWSTVYQNPNSWACLTNTTCNVPVQPAAAYELLLNLIVLGFLFYLARRVARPGILMFVYLFCYTITQFLVFFVRANDVVSFFGLFGNWGLKQAQWTSIVVFILLFPLTYWILHLRLSQPIPEGEVAVTYGVPQKTQGEKLEEEKASHVQMEKPQDEVSEVAEGEPVEQPALPEDSIARKTEPVEHIAEDDDKATPIEPTLVESEPVKNEHSKVASIEPAEDTTAMTKTSVEHTTVGNETKEVKEETTTPMQHEKEHVAPTQEMDEVAAPVVDEKEKAEPGQEIDEMPVQVKAKGKRKKQGKVQNSQKDSINGGNTDAVEKSEGGDDKEG